jgi:hypothetical protein
MSDEAYRSADCPTKVVSVGAEHQQFGDAFPARRKKMKSGKLARTQHRLEQTKALFANATA